MVAKWQREWQSHIPPRMQSLFHASEWWIDIQYKRGKRGLLIVLAKSEKQRDQKWDSHTSTVDSHSYVLTVAIWTQKGPGVPPPTTPNDPSNPGREKVNNGVSVLAAGSSLLLYILPRPEMNISMLKTLEKQQTTVFFLQQLPIAVRWRELWKIVSGDFGAPACARESWRVIDGGNWWSAKDARQWWISEPLCEQS